MNKKISTKAIIWCIIIAIILVGGGFTYNYYMNIKSGRNEAKKNQKEIEILAEDIKKQNQIEETLKPADYYDEVKIYDIMHRMANTKIIAEDNKIWGELPMKAEEINNLRAIINVVNYEDREYLLEVLSRWEEGNYSMSAEEHNYFWERLGGTIGRAIGVKEN